jgi:hypothetical protein
LRLRGGKHNSCGERERRRSRTLPGQLILRRATAISLDVCCRIEEDNGPSGDNAAARIAAALARKADTARQRPPPK